MFFLSVDFVCLNVSDWLGGLFGREDDVPDGGESGSSVTPGTCCRVDGDQGGQCDQHPGHTQHGHGWCLTIC